MSAPDCHAALIASKTLALNATYQEFSTLFAKLEHTATRLEAASASFEQVGKLGAAGLAQFGSEVDEIRFGAPELLIEPPSLVEPHTARAAVVNTLEQSLRTGHWVALSGDSGTGKSQLIRLLKNRFSECLWLNLRETSGPRQAAMIDQVFGAISKLQVGLVSRSWYVSALLAIAPGTLIVLDDLCIEDGGEPFLSRLVLLANACRGRGCFLISTSAVSPPIAISETLGTALELKIVPTYTDDDMRELLQKHGAPKTLMADHFINVVDVVTRRHPQMLSALIRFMRRQNWKYDAETLTPLLDGSYAYDLRLQIQRTMARTTSEEVRQLLYRLNVIGPRFSDTQAIEVANIAPAINGVNEKLAEVAGVWIQVLGAHQYSVSPLVTQLGSDNLAVEIKRATHAYAAGAIICRKRLNQFDVIGAITHFVQAKLFDRAAILLLQALNSLLQTEKAVDTGGILLLWMDMPLPQEMSSELKLFLRGLQTATAARHGIDYKGPLEDLERLLAINNDKGSSGVYVASSLAAIHLAKNDPKRAMKLVLRAINAEPFLPRQVKRAMSSSPSLTDLFWVFASRMKTVEDVAQWFDAVEQLPTEQRSKLWTAPTAPEGALAMLDHLWMSEQRKPAAGQQWTVLLNRIQEFSARALAIGGLQLWAFCRRAELAVRIVHLRQYEDAEAVLTETTKAVNEDTLSVFILAEGAGVWWADVERWNLAREYLAMAIDTQCYRFSSMYLRALLWRAWAESKLGIHNPGALRDAVAFAREEPDIGDLDVIVALCEQTISLWNGSNRHAAFIVWEEAVGRLLAHSEHNARWMQTYALIANNSTFFGVVARGEAVTPNVFTPETGMFLREWPDLSSQYSETTMWMLPGAMTWFADALGEIAKAGAWALRTVEIAESISLDPKRRFFLLYAVPAAIREGRYIDAIQYAFDSATSTTQHATVLVDESFRAIDKKLEEIELSRPLREPKKAELEAAQLGLLPAYLEIIRLWQADVVAGTNAADSVIEKCLQIASTAADPELWKRAATIMRQVFGRELSWEQMLAEASKYVEGYDSFHLIVLYFGAGIGLLPENVFRAHMACVRWTETCFHRFTALSNQVVGYAINGFWQAMVEKEGYRFRQPAHTLALLREAATSHSLKLTMRVVAQSLGLPLSERDRSWLCD